MAPLTIPPHIKALIFDIDGTLIDTMPTHYKASQLACRKYGFDFPLEFFTSNAGKPTLNVFEDLIKVKGLDLDGRQIGIEKELLLESLINEFTPMPIIADTAIHYFGKLAMALGTGGTRHIATKTVEAVNLQSYFEVVVTADDVIHHKPHPETFLKCAKQLGIAPEHCLVFEDAEPGIEAAKSAGMEYIDIREVVGKPDYSPYL
jgi:beta-phosphoglucomutase family hydrolase